MFFRNRNSALVRWLRDEADRIERQFSILLQPPPRADTHANLYEALAALVQSINTRSREAEVRIHELETVFANMTEGVLVLDDADKVISMNPAAIAFFGLETEDPHGRNVLEVVRNAPLERLVRAAVREEGPVSGEVELLGKPRRTLQVYGTAMDGAGSSRLSTLFVMRDVTHLKRLETIRQDFVANVSHELRTPVTAIRGYVETLLDGAYTEPEQAKRFLEIIEKHSRNLEAIIEDLLSLSRLEAEEEQRQIALAPARIRPVVEGAVQSCDAAAREKSIDVSWICEGDLTANINPPLLQQALTNLIQNAIAYSEAGRPVSIAAADDYGMHIAVHDNGPGIEARHLSRIFERFYRVDKARSRRHGGTGLGLAIVKHIMTLHRGEVTVDSTPGKGSTFTLSIPSPVAVAD